MEKWRDSSMAPLPGFSSGLLILSAHTSLQTFQILQKCTNITQKQSFYFNSTISFDLCIKNNLTLYLSKIPKTFFSPTNAAIIFPCRSCSTTKALQQMHRSVVFSPFEITIIHINYNLRFNRFCYPFL